MDTLRTCLRLAQQREDLTEALIGLRVREARLREALQKYVAGHNAYESCSCDSCEAARLALRR